MSITSDLILVGASALALASVQIKDLSMTKKKTHKKITRKNFLKKINKSDLKRFTLVGIICVAVIAIILQAPHFIDSREILHFNKDPKNYNLKLQIFNQKEKKIAEFMVAVADDDEKRLYGLMNLKHLPQNQGMVFPFLVSQHVYMWMKNTKIPLDMIFIDSDDKIAYIFPDAQPNSIEVISSQVPVKKVLEINAGLAEKFGIKVGQVIKTSSAENIK